MLFVDKKLELSCKKHLESRMNLIIINSSSVNDTLRLTATLLSVVSCYCFCGYLRVTTAVTKILQHQW